MSLSVTKEATFDCAHMLSDYSGPCANLHGHTYKIQVTVVSKGITADADTHMVMDFKQLSEVIKSCVFYTCDHAMLFSAEQFRSPAENALCEVATKYSLKYKIFPCKTTAEDMAVYFKRDITRYLLEILCLNNIEDVRVRLFETPTSYAEV